MRFTDEEITLARKLRDEGLPWEPAAGHYVYDETGFCKQSSPFQDGVYFILNYSYFMKAVGGVERFQEIMTWLPTWYDAREILRTYRVPDQQVREYLVNNQAIERGIERLSLYELIASRISAAPGGK
jgi:hypothetical protein